jgi:hypothetical protein
VKRAVEAEEEGAKGKGDEEEKGERKRERVVRT